VKTLRSKRHRALCAAIAEIRRRAGMTQRQLAAKLKKPPSYVGKIEGGERRLDVIEFIDLAEALDADPRDVIAQIRK
jgi:transcriptional regulator with XRE-family HTH domain